MAGGHLGFTPKVLETEPSPRLDDLLKEVQDALLPFEQQYGRGHSGLCGRRGVRR